MKLSLLILLAVVALVESCYDCCSKYHCGKCCPPGEENIRHQKREARPEPEADAEATPDADALLYYRAYGFYPSYYYGHLGYPYVIGRKRRDAEAAPEAKAAPDADADALLYYRTYGFYFAVSSVRPAVFGLAAAPKSSPRSI